MTSIFRPATKKNVRVVISLVGESGTGKTYTALRMASGMTNDPSKIFVLDADNGRADLLVDIFGNYQVGDVREYAKAKGRAPFDPRNAIEMIESAKAAGAEVLIIDGMSQFWEGEGGCIDIAAQSNMKGLGKWILPKQLNRKLTDTILGCGLNIFLTYKVKFPLVEDPNNQKQMVRGAPEVIREQRAAFDITCELLMGQNCMPEKYLKMPDGLDFLFPLKPAAYLTEQTGRDIIEWRQSRPREIIIAEGKKQKDLAAWFKTLNKTEQYVARRFADEIKRAAQKPVAKKVVPAGANKEDLL